MCETCGVGPCDHHTKAPLLVVEQCRHCMVDISTCGCHCVECFVDRQKGGTKTPDDVSGVSLVRLLLQMKDDYRRIRLACGKQYNQYFFDLLVGKYWIESEGEDAIFCRVRMNKEEYKTRVAEGALVCSLCGEEGGCECGDEE